MNDNKRYRIYSVNLSDINSEKDDQNFFNKIIEKKFDWWRYFPLNWVIITPYEVSTNDIILLLSECYNNTFFSVFEINIKDIGGVMPGNKATLDKSIKIESPLEFFYKIKAPDFKFNWEK
ncbi:hypothetical protein [Empedobacter brevis]|uniref:hypothetical protein n=1 Tax=Empedobacter brevis TaxID=247 RepID=UPI0039AE9936